MYFLKKGKRLGKFCPETTRVKRLNNVLKMVCLFFVVCAQMICYKILKEMQHCTAAVRKLPGLPVETQTALTWNTQLTRSTCSILRLSIYLGMLI